MLGRAVMSATEQKSHEVRLGLVMYGGVSLAIYINGVAQEFYRVVRGQGAYKLLKTLIDSDIVLDIISGSSAGGINGVLLAYALINQRKFSHCSSLWREKADIEKMFRTTKDDPNYPQSVLNSDGYLQECLEKAFSEMPIDDDEGDGSEFNELDLFVTGTDVDGNISTKFDSLGNVITVKDHRAVFLLKHRDKRRPLFEPKEVTHKALAKLARITSCFPAAFLPVLVRQGLDSLAEDQKLQDWGLLNKESCFMDGGTLYNKPFSFTIKEIFHRTADRETERKLFYVEPDPERFALQKEATQPNILQAVLMALIGIPGYQSICEDLKMIDNHNSLVDQYQQIVSALPLSALTPASLPEDVVNIYYECRLTVISKRVIQGLLRKEPGRDRLLNEAEISGAIRLQAQFQEKIPKLMKEILAKFDVYFSMRRLFRLIYFIDEKMAIHTINPEQKANYKKLLHCLNRQLKLYEIIRAAIEDMLDDTPFEWQSQPAEKTWQTLWLAIRNLFDVSLDNQLWPSSNEVLGHLMPNIFSQNNFINSQWFDQKSLSEIHKLFNRRNSKIKRVITAQKELPEPKNFQSILIKIQQYEVEMLSQLDSSDPLQTIYSGFDKLDALVYPFEIAAGIAEKDIIETVRISPLDAQKGFSNRVQEKRKTAGNSFFHFGGFFKKSWRSNDILWGRLDGLCQIFTAILSKKNMARVLRDEGLRTKIQEQLFIFYPETNKIIWKDKFNPEKLFPHSGDRTHKILQDWLEQLFSTTGPISENGLSSLLIDLEAMGELIIAAAQLEILFEELLVVRQDVIDERKEWAKYLAGTVDPPIVTTLKTDGAGNLYTNPSDPTDHPTKTTIGKFFSEQYNIGSEDFSQDIPWQVNIKLASKTMSILSNCIPGFFSQPAKVRNNPLYKLMVKYPTWSIEKLLDLLM